MPRATSEHPTELELALLKVLWAEAPLSVEEVRAHLAEATPPRELAHSSVITVLNIMHRKKYVSRRKQGKMFLFSPRVAREDVHAGMLGDLVQRVFDGSTSAVMLKLLDNSNLDRDELNEIRRLINRKAKERSE